MYTGAALSFGLIRACRSGLVLYCTVLADAGGENDGSSAIFERSLIVPLCMSSPNQCIRHIGNCSNGSKSRLPWWDSWKLYIASINDLLSLPAERYSIMRIPPKSSENDAFPVQDMPVNLPESMPESGWHYHYRSNPKVSSDPCC